MLKTISKTKCKNMIKSTRFRKEIAFKDRQSNLLVFSVGQDR